MLIGNIKLNKELEMEFLWRIHHLLLTLSHASSVHYNMQEKISLACKLCGWFGLIQELQLIWHTLDKTQYKSILYYHCDLLTQYLWLCDMIFMIMWHDIYEYVTQYLPLLHGIHDYLW